MCSGDPEGKRTYRACPGCGKHSRTVGNSPVEWEEAVYLFTYLFIFLFTFWVMPGDARGSLWTVLGVLMG